MERLELFKRFEKNIPKEIADAKDKFGQYATDLGRNMRYAGRALAEKTTSGKGKHLAILVPLIGDHQLYKTLGGEEKAPLSLFVSGCTAVWRTVGVVHFALTGDVLNLFYNYIIPTGFEETIAYSYSI